MGMIEQIEPAIISKEVARSGVDPNTGHRIIEQEKPKKTKKDRKVSKENKVIKREAKQKAFWDSLLAWSTQVILATFYLSSQSI